ncbi:scaffold attachment factor B2-like isoform X2 [Antennarius striatus]|uniref:scaffold attachment factor B2-like isoform X2 n=2 Tax=Antennarius striatus TaxID=241820 RepID=UPI0035B21C30
MGSAVTTVAPTTSPSSSLYMKSYLCGRAIRREMGLQGMLSARQLKKKWDNLKEKYKTLKNPPEGMETSTNPSSWRWFQLMDEAISGHLAGTATIVEPSLLDEEEEHNSTCPPDFHNTERDLSELMPVQAGPLEGVGMLREVPDLNESVSPVEIVAAGGVLMETQPMTIKSQPAMMFGTLLPDCSTETNKTPSISRKMVEAAAKVDRKLLELRKERQLLENEQAEFDRELMSLERDRELLNRDMVNLERDREAIEQDRAAVERDRAVVERDRVVLDRDRAFLDRDRALLERDRAFLDRAREDLERDRSVLRRERRVLDGDQVEMTTEKEVLLQTRIYQSLMAADLDQDQLETRQRLVSLFQKLVEKL